MKSFDRTLIETLVDYGCNVSTLKFYITADFIERWSHFSVTEEDFIRLLQRGLIKYKRKDQLFFVNLSLDAIDNDYPGMVPDFMFDLYRLANRKAASKYFGKGTQEAVEMIGKRVYMTRALALNADKNYRNRTYSERNFSDYLKEQGVCFCEQVPIITQNNKCYILDVLLNNRYCLELDGGYHDEDRQKTKDRLRDIELEKFGIKTLRLTNEEAAKFIGLNTLFYRAV